MLYKEFYSELGKLLYAVADVDKVITRQEKNELHKIVKEELVPLEKHTDEFGTDAAYYSEIEFDFSDEQIVDSDAAFNSFIDFITEHQTAFDEKLKKLCIHVVEKIASSYKGKNKKEKAIIKKLKDKLNTIDTKKNKSHVNEVGADPLFSSEPNFDLESGNEMEESKSSYGDIDDIIEEHDHRYDKRVKRMSRRITLDILGSHRTFI